MSVTTPHEALKEFLNNDSLRRVVEPIVEALTDSTANIDRLAAEISSRTQNDNDYHNFSQAYFQAVRYTGGSTANAMRLVELLNTLSELGSLRRIGMYIEEYGVAIAPELGNLTPLDAREWDDHLATFTNAQTWAAIYYRHGSIADVRADLLWGAELIFVNALETSLDSEVHVRASRLYLESAKQWMHICGPQLYEICHGKATAPERDWSADSGIIDHAGKWLWAGGHVLDSERWEFWKSRFAVLAGLQLLDQTSRTWARDGLRYTEEASSSTNV